MRDLSDAALTNRFVGSKIVMLCMRKVQAVQAPPPLARARPRPYAVYW